MLMYRTAPRMINKPIANTLPMEPTEAFETCHLRADLELLKADGALCVVHAVFFGCVVDEHACGASGGEVVGGGRACRMGSVGFGVGGGEGGVILSKDNGGMGLFAGSGADFRCGWN